MRCLSASITALPTGTVSGDLQLHRIYELRQPLSESILLVLARDHGEVRADARCGRDARLADSGAEPELHQAFQNADEIHLLRPGHDRRRDDA